MTVDVKDETIAPTLMERLNGALPIPYTATALLVAALLGPLGFFIADFLDSFDLGKATTLFVNLSFKPYNFWQLVGNNLVFPLIIFYCAVMVRYMRLRIIRAENDLMGGTAESRNAVKAAFRGVSSTLPAVGIAALIVFLSSTLIEQQVEANQGLAKLYFAVDYPLFFFGAGTFIWVYIRSLWGLHNLGKGPLRMRSHSEDPMMGLGGFGDLSLAFTAIFFVAVFFGLFMFSVFAANVPIVLFVLFSSFLTMTGLVTFFLPLTNIHGKMVRQKDALRNQNLGELVALVGNSQGKESVPVGDFRRVLLLDHERGQIQDISSWPFETPVIRALALIIVGIVVSIAAHIAFVLLGI